MNLGIDIGSSFIKICLLGESSISHVKRVKSPSSGPGVNGKHEVNPQLFLQIIIRLIDEYLHSHEDINGIYISTQMHCFVVVDEFGNACTDLITWKDRRSEEFFVGKLNTIDWFKKNVSSDILLQTGMGIRSGLPSLNLFVLQKQNKIKNTMSFGTIGDYIISYLTKTPISSSLSNAAATGLFDLEKNCWHYKLIDMLGLKLSLPILHRKSNEPVGSYKKVDVFSFELSAYREFINKNAMPSSGDNDDKNKLPDYFLTADNITPKEHVDIQAAAQYWIDSSISKTANVPTDYPYEEFKDIYLYAYEQGLKGCTTFRFNPEAFQGVLVKEEDLKNTSYIFNLEDGSEIELKGDEDIEYDGEIHSAANLFDALKEGYYGKF